MPSRINCLSLAGAGLDATSAEPAVAAERVEGGILHLYAVVPLICRLPSAPPMHSALRRAEFFRLFLGSLLPLWADRVLHDSLNAAPMRTGVSSNIQFTKLLLRPILSS